MSEYEAIMVLLTLARLILEVIREFRSKKK